MQVSKFAESIGRKVKSNRRVQRLNRDTPSIPGQCEHYAVDFQPPNVILRVLFTDSRKRFCRVDGVSCAYRSCAKFTDRGDSNLSEIHSPTMNPAYLGFLLQPWSPRMANISIVTFPVILIEISYLVYSIASHLLSKPSETEFTRS